jgi:hypothetical protein
VKAKFDPRYCHQRSVTPSPRDRWVDRGVPFCRNHQVTVTDNYVVVRVEHRLATFCWSKHVGVPCCAGCGQFHYQHRAVVPRIHKVGFTPSPPPACPYLVSTHDPADEVPHPWASVPNLMLALCSYPYELERLEKLQLKALEKARLSFAKLSDLHYVLFHQVFRVLTHIGLNLSIAEYLGPFSVPVTHIQSQWCYGVYAHLRYLTQVKSFQVLDLKFCDSRWNIWDHPWIGEDRPPALIKQICHNLMIAWIFRFALPFLSEVPTVHLE